MSFPFTRTLSELKIASVLIGPMERQRQRGRPYKARLGANECLFGISEKVVAAAISEVRDSNYYGDPTHSELKERLASKWRQSKASIVVGQGIEGLLELFVRAFVDPGDAVVTSKGTYPTIKYYVAGFGGRMLEVRYTDDCGIDLDGLIAVARASKAKLVYLVNPDNPTGGVISRQELRRFLHELEGISTVLLDEAYAEYAPAASLLPETDCIPNLIRLRSFSKIYGLAGARIGYAIADAELVRTVEQLRQRFGVSKLSNAMASAALESQEFIANVASRTALGRLDYEKLAPKIGARPLPSFANFVAFRFPTAHQAKRVAAWLEEGDILVNSPMDPPLDQLVRVTVGPEEDRRYLAQVLSHLPSEVRPVGVP